jgi:hypothetical protein
MGDLIEVKETFQINLQRRVSGNRKTENYELCIIFPDCMNHDNVIVWFKDEANAYIEIRDIVKSVMERDV